MIASTKFNFIYRIETKAITLNQDDWSLPTHQNVHILLHNKNNNRNTD